MNVRLTCKGCAAKRTQTGLLEQRLRKEATDAVATMLPSSVKRSIITDNDTVESPNFLILARCLFTQSELKFEPPLPPKCNTTMITRFSIRQFLRRTRDDQDLAKRTFMTSAGHLFFDLSNSLPFSCTYVYTVYVRQYYLLSSNQSLFVSQFVSHAVKLTYYA